MKGDGFTADLKQQFLAICKANIQREGIENLLEWLETTDFFTAPASTRFHGSYEGGLVQHSLNVYHCLVSSLEARGMIAAYSGTPGMNKQYTSETIAIAALFHDADMVWTWVDNTDPTQRIAVPWAMVGQQSDASQSFGSGLTYASRYFLLKYFNISTSNDDPDAFRSKQQEAARAEDKVVTDQIIQSVDAHIREYLAQNPDKADAVKKLVSKFVKNGDFFAIKESTLAGKLLQDLQKSFKIKEEK